MFEGLRKNSQSFMLIVLVASLATLFGVQFGPGGRGCSPDQLRVNHIARVHGETIGEQDFQSAARLVNLSEGRNPRVMRQAIVDGLVERELLAHEAERLGFRIDDDDLSKEIRDGYFYLSLGSRQIDQLSGGMGLASLSARQQTRYSRNAGEPTTSNEFKYEDFEQWVRGAYARTVKDYKKLMSREMLAERMRNVVTAAVRVSEDEVWRDYERQHGQVSVRYIPFSPEFYRTVVRDDDTAAIDAFAAAHAEQITEQWTARRESLRGLPVQVRIRQLVLKFPENADDAARAATRARAAALRTRIAAAPGDFVRYARLYSQDDDTWREGGESSWVTMDRINAVEDVKRAVPALQPGQISDLIASSLGIHIVQLVGRREGDVAEADAKREIARDLYRITRGGELAQEAAARAQQLLAQPNATMDSVATTIHNDALTAFYRGPTPAAEQLPGAVALEPQSHTDVGAPELRETMPFTTGSTIPGIENSQSIAQAAFRLTDASPGPVGPLTAGDDRYIIRLKERQVASREDFGRERAQLMESFTLAKRREILKQYIARLRVEAERQGQLKIGNSPLLQQRAPSQTDGEGEQDRG